MILIDKLNEIIIGRSRRTPSGWVSLNCPACTHNGEPTPDTRYRGGLKISPDGGVTFNCMRCHYRASWRPGLYLSKKMQNFLSYLDVDFDEIQKLTFKIWQENQLNISTQEITPLKQTLYEPISFPEIELPKNSKPIIELLENNFDNKDFIDSVTYLIHDRGNIISSSYEYYWSPDKKHGLNRSIIIPFYYEGKIVGWSARKIDKVKIRYFSSTPNNYIFMNHNLSKSERKYIILVEGVFDSIAIDGIGALGGALNQKQINWINNSGKEIIVVPDRTKNGTSLVDIAQHNDWYVSIPPQNNVPALNEIDDLNIWLWHEDIKDCADAVKKYGRLFTIRSILENKTKDAIKIELYKRMFMKD